MCNLLIINNLKNISKKIKKMFGKYRIKSATFAVQKTRTIMYSFGQNIAKHISMRVLPLDTHYCWAFSKFR